MVFVLGAFGFTAGSSFGVVLTALERQRRLEDLTHRRVALLGGILGLAVLAAVGKANLVPVIVFTVLVIGSAMVTVTVVKRRADTNQTDGDDDLPALDGK
jgi:hypothetical protein